MNTECTEPSWQEHDFVNYPINPAHAPSGTTPAAR